MNKLGELIKEYCLQGVVLKPLGQVVKFINGRAYKQPELLNDGKYKVLRVGNFHTNDKWYYSDLELDEDKYCNDGDLLYTWAATLGPQIWHGDKVIFHYHIWKLVFDENVLNKRFLYHFLQMDIDTISKSLTQSTMPHISMASMNKRTVPIPPLPVQSEIVRILDNFIELTTELTAELTARKKQYEYYMEQLFTFDENEILWARIDDICTTVSSGGTPNTGHSEYYGGNIPWLRTQEVNWCEITDTDIKISEEGLNNSSAKWIDENCVIVAMYGATAAKVGINKIPLTTNQACCNLQIDATKAMYKYVYYWFCNKYEELKSFGQGSQSNLNAKTVRNFPIPIPPIEKQKRIVDILDRLDTLCNDITTGLPAEIEARTKQYEYYRDKLLTFKELS